MPRRRQSTYTAEFVDGTRGVAGAHLLNWWMFDQPDLEYEVGHELRTESLFDRKEKPLVRWLKQETPAAADRPEAFVEMLGGDVLPGRVVAAAESQSMVNGRLGPHLIVEPTAGVNWPEVPRATVRVTTRWLRRIAWQRRGDAPINPARWFTRMAGRSRFRLLRFEGQSVSVLSDNDRREAKMADLAEIDMPRQDWWNAYFEQVALLTPDCGERPMQMETADGLRATVSPYRLQPLTYPRHPAPIRVPRHAAAGCSNLDSRDSPRLVARHAVRAAFAGRHAAIFRAAGSAAVDRRADHKRIAIGAGRRLAAADRSERARGPAGQRRQGIWLGIGMHAYTEMDFPLPACAVSFESRVGLDRVVGDGGCAGRWSMPTGRKGRHLSAAIF